MAAWLARLGIVLKGRIYAVNTVKKTGIDVIPGTPLSPPIPIQFNWDRVSKNRNGGKVIGYAPWGAGTCSDSRLSTISSSR